MAIQRKVASPQRLREAASINSRYSMLGPYERWFEYVMYLTTSQYIVLLWAFMGISPRSRWSNRDESSYKEQRSGTKSGIRPRTSKWAEPFAEASASMLILDS